jgi:EmrB/QacA subfamily drug resistance transporter
VTPAAAPDSAYLFSRGRTAVVLGAFFLGTFVAAVCQMLILAGIPQVVADLHGLDRYSWVFTAYFLASTVAAPLWGKLSDRHGRRRIFAVSTSIFVLGSLVCGFAPTMNVLILGRVLNGLGAGGMMPAAAAAMADLVSPRERGKWMSYQSTFVLVSSLAGPALGGLITDSFGWRWVFFAPIPLAVVAIAGVLLAFPETVPARSNRLDVVGALLLACTALPALLALNWGGNRYAWGSGEVVGLFVVAVAMCALFVLWERRVEEPIVPFTLFRSRTIVAATCAIFLVGAMHTICQTFIPLVAQGVLRHDATGAGAFLTPYMVALIVSGMIAGQFMTRTGRYRPLMIVSPFVAGTGFYLLSKIDVSISSADVLRDVALIGLGLGMCQGVYMLVIQNAAPQRMMGVVASTTHFTRNVGQTAILGIAGAILSTRLFHELGTSVGSDGRRLSPDDLLANDSIPRALAHHVQEAFAAALDSVFAIVVPLAGLLLVASLLIERRELRRTIGDAEPAPTPATPAASAREQALGSRTA